MQDRDKNKKAMHPFGTNRLNRGCMILELSEMSNSSMNGLKVLDRAILVYVASIGHVNDIPTMQICTGISRITQSKCYMR